MSNIWDEVLARIDVKINRHSYNTWFKPTAYVGDQGSTIVVRVPNALFSDWLNKHYSAVLNEALSDLGRTGTAISFVAEGQAPPPERTPVPEPAVVPALDGPSEYVGASVPDPVTAPAGLNPRYTFETFIVGSSNQCAHEGGRCGAGA